MYITSGAKQAKMPQEIDCSGDKPSHEDIKTHEIVADKEEKTGKSFAGGVKRKARENIEERDFMTMATDKSQFSLAQA